MGIDFLIIECPPLFRIVSDPFGLCGVIDLPETGIIIRSAGGGVNHLPKIRKEKENGGAFRTKKQSGTSQLRAALKYKNEEGGS